MKHFLVFLLFAAGCASGGSRAPAPAAPTDGRSPYEPRTLSPHTIEIRLDSRAAREILATLSRPKYESTDAKLLEDLPAVRLAIQDANRTGELFERDLAAAFEEESRPAVFDFRSIREDRARWESLLLAFSSREADLARMAAERAAALLPTDRPVSARMEVLLSFGLAGLADHLILDRPDGREIMIVDLARALGDVEAEPADSQLSRLARLIAGGAFRKAWASYRAGSPAWKRRDDSLGLLEPLLSAVAESGPAALFAVDENFFPLSVWLKEPMKRTLSELDRAAERLVEAERELEKRMELTTELRRPEFARRLAGPAGAYLSDAIVQAEGLDALRSALARGPRSFFEAYDRISRERGDLVPLSKVIQERLGSAPAKTPSR